MQLVIEVPDDSPLVEKINSWTDGANYELDVVQTGVGTFNLSDASESAAEEASESAETYPEDTGVNPAMKNLMASKKV